jgi:hypothetical protein
VHFDKLEQIRFETLLLYWIDFILANPSQFSGNQQTLIDHFVSHSFSPQDGINRVLPSHLDDTLFNYLTWRSKMHPYSMFFGYSIDAESQNASFLIPVVELAEDSKVKQIFQTLLYSQSTDFFRDYLSFDWFENKNQWGGTSNRAFSVPSFSVFKKYICDFELFKKSFIFYVEKITIRYFKEETCRGCLPYENKRFSFYGLNNFYIDYYADKKEFKSERENEYIIDSLLRKKGFPYEKTFDDYVRYLDENNKFYATKIYDRKKAEKSENYKFEYMRFPATLLHKILWKAPIDRKDFISHTYVVARSGSGKSEFLKTLMREMGGHCILLDPHGDFADSLDGKKGFFKVAPNKKRFVINPFDITDKTRENRELVGQEITNLIRELIADSGLSSLMDTVVKPVIQTLLKLPYADFGMLADCFNPVSGGERLEALTPLVDDTIRNWDAITGDQYETTKKSIFNRLVSFLNNGIVRDTVCGLDDFEDAIGRVVQGENLAVSLPSPTIGDDVSEVIGRFFMCRMQVWAKRRQRLPESQRTPVFLIVDECQNFLSEVTAKTLDQFGRKFGLFMVLAHQHIKQIDDNALKDSILTNCKNKIVGQASKATRQALASEMGLEQSDFEGLGRGYYWGTFEHKGTIKFYSQMVKLKDTGDGVQYATSQNRAYVNGWDIVGDDIAPDTRTHAKTQEKTRKPPKYDV